MQNHVDLFSVTGKGLIHRVVDNFLREMVRARGVGVHARTFAHWVETGQNLNGIGVIAVI